MRKYIPLAFLAGALGLLGYAFFRSTPTNENGEPAATGLDTEYQGVETFAKDALLGVLPVSPRHFSVELVGKGVCQAADGDIIAIDRKAGADASRFLATVEPLGALGKPMKPVVANFPDVPKGSKATLSLPLSLDGDARQLAFYLCYDKEGTNRCGDKTVMNGNEVFAKSAMDPKAYQPTTRVYVFSYLFYDGKQLRAFTDVVPDEFAYTRLGQFVTLFEPMQRSVDAAATEIAVAKRNDQALAPHPFDVKNGRVSVPIGYYDEKVCQENEKNAPPSQNDGETAN